MQGNDCLYEVRGRPMWNSVWTYLYVQGPQNHRNVAGLGTHQNYVWQIRSFCNSCADTSAWSQPDTFYTRCYEPDSIWTDPITPHAAQLNWNPRPSVSGYEIQGRVAGNPGWPVSISVGPQSSTQVFGLTNHVSYEWRIRTVCNAVNNVRSGWTGSNIFTTSLSARLGATNIHHTDAVDLGGLLSSTTEEQHLLVFPNPANNSVQLILPRQNATEILIKSITGLTIQSVPCPANTTELELDISGWPEGVYLVNAYSYQRVVSIGRLVVMK